MTTYNMRPNIAFGAFERLFGQVNKAMNTAMASSPVGVQFAAPPLTNLSSDFTCDVQLLEEGGSLSWRMNPTFKCWLTSVFRGRRFGDQNARSLMERYHKELRLLIDVYGFEFDRSVVQGTIIYGGDSEKYYARIIESLPRMEEIFWNGIIHLLAVKKVELAKIVEKMFEKTIHMVIADASLENGLYLFFNKLVEAYNYVEQQLKGKVPEEFFWAISYRAAVAGQDYVDKVRKSFWESQEDLNAAKENLRRLAMHRLIYSLSQGVPFSLEDFEGDFGLFFGSFRQSIDRYEAEGRRDCAALLWELRGVFAIASQYSESPEIFWLDSGQINIAERAGLLSHLSKPIQDAILKKAISVGQGTASNYLEKLIQFELPKIYEQIDARAKLLQESGAKEMAEVLRDEKARKKIILIAIKTTGRPLNNVIAYLDKHFPEIESQFQQWCKELEEGLYEKPERIGTETNDK